MEFLYTIFRIGQEHVDGERRISLDTKRLKAAAAG